MTLPVNELLAASPFGRALSEAARALLAERAILRRYRPRQILFRAGETPAGIHLVVEGRVRVVREVDGHRHVLHVEGAGGTLGEIPVFAGGTCPATAVAMLATGCLLLPRTAIAAAVTAHPALALDLLARLAGRVRELVDRLDALRFAPVSTRVARYLARHMEQCRGDWIVALPMTQEELAEELGTVREVLVRELRALRAKHILVAAGRGRVRACDPVRLQAIALGAGARDSLPASGSKSGRTA
ncbi:MAG TPA: Crp/Fnr family transcriptional regulator [Gemmatimonadaceae bacterium]